MGHGDRHDVRKNQYGEHEKNPSPKTRTVQAKGENPEGDIDDHEQQLDSEPGGVEGIEREA